MSEPLARARESARRLVDRRQWGDTRNDAVAKRYYDTAMACALEVADAVANDTEAEWCIERATGQRQLDEALVLIAESAALFTRYAEHHKARAAEPGDAEQQAESLRKAHLNLSMALSLREFMAAHAATLPLDEAVAVLQRARGEQLPAKVERFANREGYGNVRPVTTGPLAEPSVAGMVAAALAGDAPCLAMAGPTFRLQTADPRFDPTEPVVINGYPFAPATES